MFEHMLTLLCAGYKLDFKKNAALNGYVKSSFTKIGDRSDGYPQWKSKAGSIYCVSVLGRVLKRKEITELTAPRMKEITGMSCTSEAFLHGNAGRIGDVLVQEDIRPDATRERWCR